MRAPAGRTPQPSFSSDYGGNEENKATRTHGSVATGGLIGIGGTLLGVGAQEGLASWREYRQKQRRLLIAMTGVVSELLATVGIFSKALERGA